jgi:hypothetical protein
MKPKLRFSNAKHSRNRVTFDLTSPLGYSSSHALGDSIRMSILAREKAIALAEAAPRRIIMRAGHWCVPPSERPEGWELMPVKEYAKMEDGEA